MLQTAGRNLAHLAVPDCIRSAEQAAAGTLPSPCVTCPEDALSCAFDREWWPGPPSSTAGLH